MSDELKYEHLQQTLDKINKIISNQKIILSPCPESFNLITPEPYNSVLINMSRWDLLEHNTNPWGTWDRARTQRAKRKRAKPDAWRTEAQTARRDLLAAVATMHEPDPILYGDDLQRHIRAKVHKAVRLLCRSIMAWARARDLAHVAQNAAALDYCTRGLRAAQLTPRPPLWCPEIEEPEA